MSGTGRTCLLCDGDLPAWAWKCPSCKARIPRSVPPLVAHLGIIAGVIFAMAVIWRSWAGERADALLRALLD